ncbi:hypothetical protein ABZ951_27195 [Streptomyces sp. NPDC046215]
MTEPSGVDLARQALVHGPGGGEEERRHHQEAEAAHRHGRTA